MTIINAEYANRVWNITVRGHAGYGARHALPAGCDIVCAAVSCLTQTLAQIITDLDRNGYLEWHEIAMDSGDAELSMIVSPGAVQMVEHMMYPIQTGFEMLSSTFSEHVQSGWGNVEMICDTMDDRK